MIPCSLMSHITIDNLDIIAEIEVLLFCLGWIEASPSDDGPRWFLLEPEPIKKIMASAIIATDGPDELVSISNDAKCHPNPWLAFRSYLSIAALDHILQILRCQYDSIRPHRH